MCCKRNAFIALSISLVLVLSFGGLGLNNEFPVHQDGRYRGTYEDRGVQQVSIQFHLEDEILQSLSYRHLFHGGIDYRQLDEGDPLYPVVQQHQQILEYLEGKHVSAIVDLYAPGAFIDDIDTFSGATIRGSKVLSAMVDGLNRGPYTPAGQFHRDLGEHEDGRYRGVFADRGVQQVSIQFHLDSNVLSNLSYRHLYHGGIDYRHIGEGHALYPVVKQHQQILDHLEGKHVSAIYDLYTPEVFIEDIDAFSGATIRGSKILSAMVDGLNRGLYVPAGDFRRELGTYEDGRYRGIFADRGVQQVSIQFHLADNVLENLSYRHLYHSGTDYRQIGDDHALYPVVQQHQQILDHLDGQPLSAVFDLHAPGDFIDDIDGFTGATVRANKVLSAIRDGLNRGIY